MNRVCGMSLKQFNDVLDEMRTLYPFQDDKTVLGELRDMPSDTQCQVEIMTRDERTGVMIVMSKGIDRGRK